MSTKAYLECKNCVMERANVVCVLRRLRFSRKKNRYEASSSKTHRAQKFEKKESDYWLSMRNLSHVTYAQVSHIKFYNSPSLILPPVSGMTHPKENLKSKLLFKPIYRLRGKRKELTPQVMKRIKSVSPVVNNDMSVCRNIFQFLLLDAHFLHEHKSIKSKLSTSFVS